jgi:hypothetical protein
VDEYLEAVLTYLSNTFDLGSFDAFFYSFTGVFTSSCFFTSSLSTSSSSGGSALGLGSFLSFVTEASIFYYF